jgi:hypothetical protein
MVREMSQWERQALVREYGVSGKGHDLLGFVSTNLGSGRDNAPRCLGQPGCLAVDMITYYKMMLDDEAKMSHLLGDWENADRLQNEAAKIKDLINKEYWNEKLGLYTDLVKTGENTTEQSDIRTMVGFWPIDGRWLMEGLYVNGRRAEASRQYGRIMGGVNESSDWFRTKGDTPHALVHGQPSPEELEQMKKQGVFWEAYGRVKDPETQRLRATYNREYTKNGDLHMTRPGLAWSLSLVKSGKKYEEGFEAIPAYSGPIKTLPSWNYELLTNELYSHHNIGNNPALRPLVDYLKSNKVTRRDFQAMWDRPNSPIAALLKSHPEIREQLNELSRGPLEISPTFDPGINQTSGTIHYKGPS